MIFDRMQAKPLRCAVPFSSDAVRDAGVASWGTPGIGISGPSCGSTNAGWEKAGRKAIQSRILEPEEGRDPLAPLRAAHTTWSSPAWRSMNMEIEHVGAFDSARHFT